MKKQNEYLMTAKELAETFGLPVARIRQLIKIGLPKEGFNKFNFYQCMHWYIDYLKYWRDRRSIKEIAEMFGISERWVQRLTKEQRLQKEKRGVYNMSQTIRNYINYLRDEIKKVEEICTTTAGQKKRLLRVQADIKEMELIEKQQQLLPVQIVQDLILNIKKMFLEKLKAHLLSGAIVNKLFDSKAKKDEMLEILRNEIYRIKLELSQAGKKI